MQLCGIINLGRVVAAFIFLVQKKYLYTFYIHESKNEMEEFDGPVKKFLQDFNNSSKYVDKIMECIQDGKFRLIVNVDDLRGYLDSKDFAKMMERPRELMMSIQRMAKDVALSEDATIEKLLENQEIQCGFEGSFGYNAISPRGLRSDLLNQIVDVEGIVTKCSNVRPKLVRTVHYCPKSDEYTKREFKDQLSLDIGINIDGKRSFPSTSVIPSKDGAGNDLEMEYGFCKYKDYQTIVVQEMPERARVGQLPRSIQVVIEDDLVDKVKPGDRIKVVGVYRPISDITGQSGAPVNALFKTVLMCNNIKVIGKEVGGVQVLPGDIDNFRDVCDRHDILDIMGKSLCPSIFGHDFIKKALILQLLGGCEKNLDNGTHIRGDINMLMVGDPSTAKSQLLRSIIDIAELAISTTGRGSSGVGLTAAVTSDSETGERRLEAGAMVLADRGIVCVDEFDKMSENDRVAIHEVMEQQTVTIAKAGIHASLNARCSVLAAANPVYGNYDKTRRPQENIGLPDSLLSRFDLLFIILDQLDPDTDRRLSEHVIRSHQYRRPGSGMEPEPLNQGSSLAISLDEDEGETSLIAPVWLRGGKTVESSKNSKANRDVRQGDIFTKDFLRKYLYYAKQQIKPELTDVAMEVISAAYATMRSKQSQRNLPVTARSLETIIRLSTASAKARLSPYVEERDADQALALLNYVMFHEIGSKESDSSSSSSSSNNLNGKRTRDAADDSLDDLPSTARANNNDNSAYDELELEAAQAAPVVRSSKKYTRVIDIISKMFQSTSNGTLQFGDVLSRLNAQAVSSTDTYSRSELHSILSDLEGDNKIMYSDDVIHEI